MNSKLKTPAGLAKILSRLRSKGKRIVFTNGCFDILHAGHIIYLKKAKKLGDILVVGLNSDSSVRSIKGTGRPINSQKDRALVLSSLSFVDYVVVFAEKTPERLICEIKPDILAKGSDWSVREIVGGELVKARGGKVVAVPFVKGYSTTSLIERIARCKEYEL